MIIEIDNVQEWLNKNKYKLHSIVDHTECFKWKKWYVKKDTYIFPCVCPVREHYCLEMELFYRVWLVQQMINKEQCFVDAILDYNVVKTDKGKKEHWLTRYKTIYEDVVQLDEKFRVTYKKHPNRTIEVLLPKDEIKHLLRFKELYSEAI